MHAVLGHRLFNVVFAGLAIIIGAWFSFYNNFCNWDLVPYAGVVLGYDGLPADEVHRQAFQTIQQQLPPDVVQSLLHEVPYREQCFTSVEFYNQQLGFYRVKPLFTGLIYVFYKLGLPLWTAMRLPGVIGFAALAIVLMVWLNKWLKPGWSHLVAALFLSGYATQLARLVSPDALCAFLTLGFFYALCYHASNKWAAWLVLALLVLCRIDNVLLALPLAAWQYSGGRHLLKLPRKQYWQLGVGAGVLLFITLLIPVLLGNKLNWYFDYSITHSVMEYVKSAARSVRQLADSWLPLLAALLLLCWPQKEDSLWQWILGSIVATITVRWLLFPTFQERFFVGYEMVFCCYFVYRLSKSVAPSNIFMKPMG